jgi:hypothetical protein
MAAKTRAEIDASFKRHQETLRRKPVTKMRLPQARKTGAQKVAMNARLYEDLTPVIRQLILSGRGAIVVPTPRHGAANAFQVVPLDRADLKPHARPPTSLRTARQAWTQALTALGNAPEDEPTGLPAPPEIPPEEEPTQPEAPAPKKKAAKKKASTKKAPAKKKASAKKT